MLNIWLTRIFAVHLQPKSGKPYAVYLGSNYKMIEYKKLGFAHLMKLMLRYWQWFLLSVVICLCAALLYVRYVTPVYKFSARVLVLQADNPGHGSSNRMLKYVKNVGSVSKALGVDNEVEMLWSSALMQDVVMSLKLYTDYRVDGWPKRRLVYATQPISVDLDPVHLDSIDKIAYDEYCSISMKMKRKSDRDSTILVDGILASDDDIVWGFKRKIKSFPAVIKTPYGTLTLTRNPNGESFNAGQVWYISIEPPLGKAMEYLGHLRVSQLEVPYYSYRRLERFYYKKSGIVKLTLVDRNKRRGVDILKQYAASYNRRANQDKNEVAEHTEAFINERLVKLSEELGQKDNSIVDIKQQSYLTKLADATQSVVQADRYSSKLIETEAELMMLNYLNEYVTQPENKYKIIPSNMGLRNGVTEKMIRQYNKIVQERKRMLMSASEESPQVKRLTSEADDINAAILAALQQAQQTVAIEHKGIGTQYAAYRGKIAGAPRAEKVLADVGREQKIKNRLFKILLQKREENSIAQSSIATHGKLIDEPMLEGKVRPNLWKALGIALGISIAIPYGVFFLLGFFRYKVENRKELEKMTELPIIGEVPMVSANVKKTAGIVVRFGENEAITESFRMIRSNVHFMLKSGEHTILFTSSTSGEGKSFCAANLAMSYALLQKKAILCGLDIRKPALGSLFNIEDKDKGISTLLSLAVVTEADVENQIQPSGLDEYLDILPAGPIPPNPTELFARESFAQVMSILKKKYDYVILDTAPVGLVTDTLLIGRHADMTVFVCRAFYTPGYSINQLNFLAEEKRLPNASFVINGVEAISQKAYN